MKKSVIIILALISANSFSQEDSLHRKLAFGTSVNLVNFIEYHTISGNIFDKTAYYQGFDLNVFLRLKKAPIQFELGTFGGSAYPILRNLNYYIGTSGFLESKNKKFMFDIHPKLMFSYSQIPDGSGNATVRESVSFQIGTNAYRKFRKIEIGFGYYAWFSYYFTGVKNPYTDPYASNSSNGNITTKYSEGKFVPIGIFQISTRFIIR